MNADMSETSVLSGMSALIGTEHVPLSLPAVITTRHSLPFRLVFSIALVAQLCTISYAFGVNGMDVGYSSPTVVVLVVVNIITMVYILFQYNTTLYIGHVMVGLQLSERRHVQRWYQRTWLVIDVLLSLPIDVILCAALDEKRYGTYCGCLRFLSIPRLFDVMTYNPFYAWKGILAYATTLMCLCAHFVACVLTQDGNSYQDGLRESVSILTMLGSSTSPNSTFTKVVVSMYSLSVTFFHCSVIVGMLLRFRQFHDTEPDDSVRRWLPTMQQTMTSNNIPLVVQRALMESQQLSSHCSRTSVLQDLNIVSPALYRAVMLEIKLNLLSKPKALRIAGASCMEALASVVQVHIFGPNDIVVQKDAPASSMYWLVAGILEAVHENMEPIMRISPGAWFGEQCLVTLDATRVTTVVSVSASMLFSLDRLDVHSLAGRFPVLTKVVPAESSNPENAAPPSGAAETPTRQNPHTQQQQQQHNQMANSDEAKRASVNPLQPFVPMGHNFQWHQHRSSTQSDHSGSQRGDGPKVTTTSTGRAGSVPATRRVTADDSDEDNRPRFSMASEWSMQNTDSLRIDHRHDSVASTVDQHNR
eukprot:PhM_4_TR5772/c0_g1_i2/m.30698